LRGSRRKPASRRRPARSRSNGRKTRLASDAFAFTTDLGWLDLLGTPAGTTGYEDLVRTADAFDLFGYRVLVAAVEDLIRMKRASGRPKDLPALEELGALRHVLDEG
jgi:hypothetical protein